MSKVITDYEWKQLINYLDDEQSILENMRADVEIMKTRTATIYEVIKGREFSAKENESKAIDELKDVIDDAVLSR